MITELQTECRARDPEVSYWFLNRLLTGEFSFSSSGWKEWKELEAGDATPKPKPVFVLVKKKGAASKNCAANPESDSSKDSKHNAQNTMRETSSTNQGLLESAKESSKRTIYNDQDADQVPVTQSEPSKKKQKIAATANLYQIANARLFSGFPKTNNGYHSYQNLLARSQRLDREENKLAEAEQTLEEEERRAELTRKNYLHTHSFPRGVNTYPLSHGNPRAGNCAFCRQNNNEPLLSHGIPRAGECNFCRQKKNNENYQKLKLRLGHVPKLCNEENTSETEKENRDKMENLRRKKEIESEEDRRKRIEKETEEHRQRLEAETCFSSKIRTVEGNHRNPKSLGFNFTVWCSDIRHRDRYYSSGSSYKEFDSVWKTKKEAHTRAEYLFFWHNRWGYEPDELKDYCKIVLKNAEGGCKKWEAEYEGGSTWTVGVAPSTTYPHIPNASPMRHSYDKSKV